MLAEAKPDEEPQFKRQKSAEPSTRSTISDKFAANKYETIDEVVADVAAAVDEALKDLDAQEKPKEAVRLREFKREALKYAAHEKAYPRVKAESQEDPETAFQDGSSVLSIVGFAPQERRLFSSLPASEDVDLSDVALPPGVSIATITRSYQQMPTRTLGELFGSQRALPPLKPPKQPKTQAKGTAIDFYRPEPTNARTNCYFNTKLSSGYYLDYSNAIPSSQAVPKQRERAESLAGKKPSMSELEMSEVESLFRGAFSTFAPCKDDSAAIVPSSVAGRIWWQRSGQQIFERMLDADYYGDKQNKESTTKPTIDEIDEAALQDAIDHWDETAVDPSLDEFMGIRSKADKDTDDILGEVSDLIETLASYQRIRNLTLPNSQNRQSSDPVTGDMLASSGPEPTEDEVATYEILKSQLALIVKTLPPFAVAKLDGDQLNDLLISTKIQVHTDDYHGTMEEDEAGVQARLRVQQQQQQQQQQAVQTARQQPQRTPSAGGQYPTQYPAAAQYGTPGRTPQPQQYFRPGSQPGFQPQRNATPQPSRPPQPNQYTRPNGYPANQYATQLAKAQTPYGHQNMPQYANQQRQQFVQAPQAQPGTPNAAAYHQYQPQQPQGVATQGNYGGYANGTPQSHAQHPPAQQQRHMSPPGQQQRQTYSQSPNMQTQQRFATPTPQPGTPGQAARYVPGASQPGYSQSPGLTGYHTVISEAQQQRILEQAKARVAAGGQPGSYSNAALAAARANRIASQQKPQTPTAQRASTPVLPPHRVTPVPVPPIPGTAPQPPPQ